MGCDMYCHAESSVAGEWKEVYPKDIFTSRSYAIYGFLANVRNYSKVPPIAERRGLPIDVSASVNCAYENILEGFATSWLTVEELANFDYNCTFEERRCMINGNGGSTCDIGKGVMCTFKDFLGNHFFDSIEELKKVKADRIVFWFAG